MSSQADLDLTHIQLLNGTTLTVDGQITGNLTGDVTGNADTATTATTATTRYMHQQTTHQHWRLCT